jgi:hypothetical protein
MVTLLQVNTMCAGINVLMIEMIGGSVRNVLNGITYGGQVMTNKKLIQYMTKTDLMLWRDKPQYQTLLDQQWDKYLAPQIVRYSNRNYEEIHNDKVDLDNVVQTPFITYSLATYLNDNVHNINKLVTGYIEHLQEVFQSSKIICRKKPVLNYSFNSQNKCYWYISCRLNKFPAI